MLKDIAAALIFFTRLPFWRIKAFDVAHEHYKQVVNYWPITGWITAPIMAGSLWLSAQVLPYSIAIIIALLSRVLVTGALHEDGLADFFDGMGGGRTKERILEIMKDSHIGTYGVITLIFYFVLFHQLLFNFNLETACITILIADPLCKLIGAQITLFLPYARNEETSKSKTVYRKMSIKTLLPASIFGLLPLILFFRIELLIAVLFPIIIFSLLILFMKNKIQGYTGDCCGATFLLCELSFYIGIVSLSTIIQ